MTMTFDFSAKKVLITGASKGIGRSIAEQFLEAGATVAICARGQKDLETLQCRYNTHKLFAFSADVTNACDVKDVVCGVNEKLGGLDILINNVGGAIVFGDLWTATDKNWTDAFELNVLSMVRFCREAIPYLRNSKHPRVINISSISGVEPGFYNPHYASTKAATINFSKYLANILASEHILVNCVCPGTIETNGWEKGIEQILQKQTLSTKEELRLKDIQTIPLGRIGQGEDIASMVLFLAGDGANWTTGSCFHINGGKMRST